MVVIRPYKVVTCDYISLAERLLYAWFSVLIGKLVAKLYFPIQRSPCYSADIVDSQKR